MQQVVDNADVIHIHDEWTRMKFDEGKYKSSEIYGTPKDPASEKRIRGIPEEAARGDSPEVNLTFELRRIAPLGQR